MRYVDHPALRELATAISEADSADQTIDARLELYALESHQSDANFEETRDSQRHHSSKSVGQLTSHFVNALSETFPDYHFDGLNQTSFTKREDLNAVVNYINQTLGCSLERAYPKVVPDLWRSLRQLIHFSDCDLYELVQEVIDEAKLWSFCYFWYDRKHQRILLFSCRSRSRVFKTASDTEDSVMSWGEDKSHSSQGGGVPPEGFSSIDGLSSNEDDYS